MQLAALALAYLVVAKLGLKMDAVSGFATLVWPATGLALAALFLVGLRLWPGIWLGAALVNWVNGAPAWVAAGIAIGNTLEAVIGATLLRRIGFRPSLDRVRGVLAFAGPIAIPAAMVSATVGVASLLAGHVIAWHEVTDTWRAWWLGDLIAALVVAPLLLAWGSASWRTQNRARRLPEAAALGLLLVAVVSLVFLLPSSTRQPYLVFLPLIWAALRFGFRYVTLAIFLASAIAVLGTSLGLGPYARPILHESLSLLQAFMAVVAVTILVLHAVTTELAQHLEGEKAARVAAQDARQRYAFLADASASIDAHLDVAALTSLGNLAVSHFADWCEIDFLDDDGSLRRIVVVQNPEMQHAARQLERAEPDRAALPVNPRDVIRTRKSVLHRRHSGESLETSVPDPGCRSLLQQLGFDSSIHVPMLAHGRVYGVISLVRAAPDRPFTRDDLFLAEDLARRAGHAAEAGSSFRRTEESRRLLNAVIEGTTDLVYAKDRAGRYLMINSAGARAVGRTPAEVVGKSDADLFPAQTADAIRATDHRILVTDAAEQFEQRVQTTEGDRIFWTTKAPCRDETGIIGVVGISRDITDRKEAEVVRESDRRKGEFLAMLSHELRNPLAPIRSSIYVLKRAAPGGEQAQRAMAVIERQSQHISRLVDDLLDVTRISRGKLQIRRRLVELNGLVLSVVEDQRDQFTNGGIALEARLADEPLWVNGDPTRLTQVVGNLLQNAAKFTLRGGRTVVSVERGGDASATLRVRDTGMGIEPEMTKHMFEPFAQADRTLDRSRGGLGLGLALVKGIVSLHDGSVAAHSEGRGRGAELVVHLPLAEPERPSVPTPAAQAQSPARRVLVIEDNVDGAQSLKDALEMGGHVVELAYSGPSGIEKARAFGPDVILCDIGLPGVDGYGVAAALRADERLSSVFLVALSGYAAPEDVERSREAGFDLHLAKPLDFDELERVLAAAPAGASAFKGLGKTTALPLAPAPGSRWRGWRS